MPNGPLRAFVEGTMFAIAYCAIMAVCLGLFLLLVCIYPGC